MGERNNPEEADFIGVVNRVRKTIHQTGSETLGLDRVHLREFENPIDRNLKLPLQAATKSGPLPFVINDGGFKFRQRLGVK